MRLRTISGLWGKYLRDWNIENLKAGGWKDETKEIIGGNANFKGGSGDWHDHSIPVAGVLICMSFYRSDRQTIAAFTAHIDSSDGWASSSFIHSWPDDDRTQYATAEHAHVLLMSYGTPEPYVFHQSSSVAFLFGYFFLWNAWLVKFLMKTRLGVRHYYY